jgi:hypothetical protein
MTKRRTDTAASPSTKKPAAEYPSGRVRLPSDPDFPGALVEVAPDGRRYLVELVRVAGRKRLRRVAEVSSRQD